MGPIALFDKSFLQSLNTDESVWFDHFFISNICPLFYIETLADLEKSVKKGRPPEKVVGEIANKFPEAHSMPNAYHENLIIGNLMGQSVPMTGQIPISSGRPVKVAGKTGVVVEQSPEAEAFSRWQNGDFLSIERKYARAWRNQLNSTDLTNSEKYLEKLGIDKEQYNCLDRIKLKAEDFVCSMTSEQLQQCLDILNVPHNREYK